MASFGLLLGSTGRNAGRHFDCVLGADISRHYKPDIRQKSVRLLDTRTVDDLAYVTCQVVRAA
jgi:hypothetical protein